MVKDVSQERLWAITKLHEGERPETICATLGRSRTWLYKWSLRYSADDQMWNRNQSKAPQTHPNRTLAEIEEIVQFVRLSLYNHNVFYGAQAIQWEMEELGIQPLPSLRTINRILVRHDLTHRRTGRYVSKHRLYPYLPAHIPNEVQQTDFVGPFYMHQRASRFYSLNTVDVCTGRVSIEPLACRAGKDVVGALWSIWWRLGMPQNIQVDNELVFYGSNRYPRGMGPLIRLCLLYGIEPWFIPQKEPWRNGVVEKFNDHFRYRFLRKVYLHDDPDLKNQARVFEDKHNRLYRYSKLNGRTPMNALQDAKVTLTFPPMQEPPELPLKKPTAGRYHLVRLIRSNLVLNVFEQRYNMPADLMYEYVVATIDVKEQKLKLYHDQIQVEEFDYKS